MTRAQKPVLAVTMGDPAGVGPEVIVRALADASLGKGSRPVVFGDRHVLDAASAVTGAAVPWHVVADAKAAADPGIAASGRVALVDMNMVDPSSWAWGRLAASHGKAAAAYLDAAMQADRKSTRLNSSHRT